MAGCSCPGDSTALCSACPTGYRLHLGDCLDVDECAVGNGGCAGGCQNVVGGFVCLPYVVPGSLALGDGADPSCVLVGTALQVKQVFGCPVTFRIAGDVHKWDSLQVLLCSVPWLCCSLAPSSQVMLDARSQIHLGPPGTTIAGPWIGFDGYSLKITPRANAAAAYHTVEGTLSRSGGRGFGIALVGTFLATGEFFA